MISLKGVIQYERNPECQKDSGHSRSISAECPRAHQERDMDIWSIHPKKERKRNVFDKPIRIDAVYRKGVKMRKALNAITVISLITVILTACMVDSESMIPAYICGISVLVLGLTCMVRERL